MRFCEKVERLVGRGLNRLQHQRASLCRLIELAAGWRLNRQVVSDGTRSRLAAVGIVTVKVVPSPGFDLKVTLPP